MRLFEKWRAKSPFYDETHQAVADSVRTFVQREVEPHIDQWERDGELPRELHRKAAAAGILGLGYPEEYGGHSDGFDVFHSMTQSEELAAPGAGGLGASLMTHGIGLPPILALRSDEMKRRIAPEVLAGEKIISLAITEPGGGSDVAALKTRAEKRGKKPNRNTSPNERTLPRKLNPTTASVRFTSRLTVTRLKNALPNRSSPRNTRLMSINRASG